MHLIRAAKRTSTARRGPRAKRHPPHHCPALANPRSRAEFLSNAAPFANLKTARRALDEWVDDCNTARPHQSLKVATPAERFGGRTPASSPPTSKCTPTDRGGGEDWVARRVCANGIVCVSWQRVCIGRHYAGQRCDVHVDGELLRFWVGDQLVKTAARTSRGQVRNNEPCAPARRPN